MMEKGRLLSASFRAAIWPVNFCTSLLVCGGYICRIAFILAGLASMPFVVTRQPSTLPLVTPKTHFSELILSLPSHILAKVSARLEMYDAFFLLTITMSSA
jgi:hypothetical protein